MAHVFISYSSKDETQALAIADLLESQDISCWVACRDIPAGTNFASQIPPAIRECPVFLILLTNHSINSMDVLNELTLASRYSKQQKKLIVPLGLEDISLPGAFDYHLATVQIRPFALHEDAACIDLIGTIHDYFAPKTDINSMQERWGNGIEMLRNQLLAEFESGMKDVDQEALEEFYMFMEFIKTCTPTELVEAYCEIMREGFLNGEIDIEKYKKSVMNVLLEYGDRIPGDYAKIIPGIALFLENASAEEIADFNDGFLLGGLSYEETEE